MRSQKRIRVPPFNQLYSVLKNNMSTTPFKFDFNATPKDWPASAGAWTGSDEQLKRYNAPSPCKWNDACVYTKCCGFVHAGEEGSCLKYFPGRSAIASDGKQFWESPCLRLIGSPNFYERRRLHLSWPAWCKRQGIALPVPLCERLYQRNEKKEPTLEEIVKREEAFQLARWQSHQKTQASFLPFWYRHGITESTESTESQAKNALGEQIYMIVKESLHQTIDNRAILNLAHPSVNACKITGMILEAHNVNELEQLLTNDAELSRNIWQGVHVMEAYATGKDTECAAVCADDEWSAAHDSTCDIHSSLIHSPDV